MAKIELLHIDCMEFMRGLPDKAFDLAIVDPPYGIGEDGASNHSRGKLAKPTMYTANGWDSCAPPVEYFNELRRVSVHQIVWGANHFISRLPIDSPSWVVWDKMNGDNDFADCELAWSSFPTAMRQFRFRWAGMLQGNMAAKEARIHPTQKPVALYRWLLKNYAKPGQRILDTHLGSGSIAIACDIEGFDLVGCEIDADYIAGARKRLADHQAQPRLFDAPVITETQLSFHDGGPQL
jgi:site-specific DNA-methyltransferase (adenine-specific)